MKEELNRLGRQRDPFVFVISYDKSEVLVFKTDSSDILYDIDGFKNHHNKDVKKPKITSRNHISFEEYLQQFNKIIEEIKRGNTYLLNLTAPTNIDINSTLEDIFYTSNATFKLCLPDNFVVFSPERFIKIQNNQIETYPMKGTANADNKSLDNLKNSQKELAEHTMVVDLLRNDLSIVATNVRVKNFREYIKIHAGDRELYQSISAITGNMSDDWQNNIGDILFELLPAGSISGTPKRKTVEIINKTESYKRGFFTGIFGYFDGENLDSAVMIRFIEKTASGYLYKSGGGITLDSDVKSEYEEMCAKVYIPSI